MSTGSLLRWIALVAGGELAVRGYVAGSVALCHAGAALFALALAVLVGRTRARWIAVGLGAGLLAVTAVDAVLALRAEPQPEPIGEAASQCAVVVEAGSTSLPEDLSGQLVLVRAVMTHPRRASPLGRAIENARRGPTSDLPIIAAYRKSMLAARRAGADVALLVPPGDDAVGLGVRALAGSYGIRAIDSTTALDDILDQRQCR